MAVIKRNKNINPSDNPSAAAVNTAGLSPISLKDEDGNQADFQPIDTFLRNGSRYMIMIPAKQESPSVDAVLVLKQDPDNETSFEETEGTERDDVLKTFAQRYEFGQKFFEEAESEYSEAHEEDN